MSLSRSPPYHRRVPESGEGKTKTMNFATPVMAGAGGAGAAGGAPGRSGVRLAPDVNRILYVRNLPYKMTGEDLYEVFGQFGTIRQIRASNKPETKGTAFVVFDDIFDAKTAVENLTGFNVLGRCELTSSFSFFPWPPASCTQQTTQASCSPVLPQGQGNQKKGDSGEGG